MRVLAIDTALAACSAAVLDTALGGIVASESVPMVRGHAEALMPIIARVMGRSDLEFPDVDRIVVTTGPGSFTGLRVGISAARGIALASAQDSKAVTDMIASLAGDLIDLWPGQDGYDYSFDGFGELDVPVPGYAATIHKSQGSEYPAVIIPVSHSALPHAATQPSLRRRPEDMSHPGKEHDRVSIHCR